MPQDRARPIGPLSLVALGVNGIVGVGIFFAPASVAAEIPGFWGAAAYLGTALLMLPIALGYAALGKRFSVDGGPYVWADAAFGPHVGFSVGWITYASSIFSMSAVALGLSHHASPLLGITTDAGQRAAAVAFIVALGTLASTGLHPSAIVWSGVTVLKLVPLLALVAVGTLRYATVVPAPGAVPQPSEVLFHDVERAALVVVFAMQGFEIVPVLAGSVRHSEKAVPWGTVGSLLVVSLLYAALHAVSVHAVPGLGSSGTPLVAAASQYGGASLGSLVAAGANLSALGIAFGMVNTTPRYLGALSGETSLGPWIGRTDRNFVPQRALWITIAAVAVLVVGAKAITELFVVSSLAVLLQYSVVLASLAVLSVRRQHGLHPKNLWPVPLSLGAIVLAAQGAERKEIGTAAAVLAVGETIRWARNRRRAARGG